MSFFPLFAVIAVINFFRPGLTSSCFGQMRDFFLPFFRAILFRPLFFYFEMPSRWLFSESVLPPSSFPPSTTMCGSPSCHKRKVHHFLLPVQQCLYGIFVFPARSLSHEANSFYWRHTSRTPGKSLVTGIEGGSLPLFSIFLFLFLPAEEAMLRCFFFYCVLITTALRLALFSEPSGSPLFYLFLFPRHFSMFSCKLFRPLSARHFSQISFFERDQAIC